MFETTSQITLNDSIVDDSRLFSLFGGVRVQPLWFSTNHGSTHLLHQRPTHDTNECDKIGYIPPKIIKNSLAKLGYPAQSSIFSHLIYFIFLSISPLTERQSNSIKLTYSRFSQQIYDFINTSAFANPGLGHGVAKGHRKAQSSRHNVWRARQDPSGTPVECPLRDSRRCPGRRLETCRNDRRPCHGQ